MNNDKKHLITFHSVPLPSIKKDSSLVKRFIPQNNHEYKEVKTPKLDNKIEPEVFSKFYCEEIIDDIHQQLNERRMKTSQFVDNWFCDRLKEYFGFKGDFYNYEEVKNFLEDNNIQIRHIIGRLGDVEFYHLGSKKYRGLITLITNVEKGTIDVDTKWEELME